MTDIPRTIWFYWHQGLHNAPDLVQRCHRSWECRNPGWNVVTLDAGNVSTHLKGIQLPAPTPQVSSELIRVISSELIRVNLLRRYGGVWTDASCFCMRPLDEWLSRYIGSGFFAFSSPGPDRLVASWFLASAQGGYIASRWADAANAYWSAPGPTRMMPSVRLSILMTRASPDVWFTKPIKSWLRLYPYYWFHYLFGHLYIHDREFMAIWEATPRFTADVPHSALVRGLAAPIDDGLKREIDQRAAPLYKLNWRRGEGAGDGSVLRYLYRTL